MTTFSSTLKMCIIITVFVWVHLKQIVVYDFNSLNKIKIVLIKFFFKLVRPHMDPIAAIKGNINLTSKVSQRLGLWLHFTILTNTL